MGGWLFFCLWNPRRAFFFCLWLLFFGEKKNSEIIFFKRGIGSNSNLTKIIVCFLDGIDTFTIHIPHKN